MDDKLTTSNKDAMSRALGAAFLSHRVEQLEKTVSTTPPSFGYHPSDRRDRRSLSFSESASRGRGGSKRGGAGRGHGGIAGNAIKPPGEGESHRPQRFETRGRESESNDFDDKDGERNAKDADVVVVDSSVLVHAIGELKKWCRYNREEIVIVPLEALNTLDMLKKGSSSLAQRARAASRILEQQVGTNPRIIVQRDDAFVLWDNIPITSQDSTTESASDGIKGLEVEARMTPEWLRRTICCARWEVEHVQETLANAGRKTEAKDNSHDLKVVLAVCIPLSVIDSNVSSTAVPEASILNKHEQRASGVLVSLWANRSGVSVLKVETTAPPSSGGNHQLSNGNSVNNAAAGGRPRSSQARHNRGSSDEDRRGSPAINGRPRGGSIGRGKAGPKPHYSIAGGEKLVERPATTVAMNASAMLQPTRVVRVLARGEKLDP